MVPRRSARIEEQLRRGLERAAASGDLRACEALIKRLGGVPWTHTEAAPCNWYCFLNDAARNGHLHILEWAHSRNMLINRTLGTSAARGEQSEVLVWLARTYGMRGVDWAAYIEANEEISELLEGLGVPR